MVNGLLLDVSDTDAISQEQKARMWQTIYQVVEEGFAKASLV